ncbi:MAG: hypothetical protein U5K76_13085 [Woeseiaceae bacterium]|nr:hypothetical protein [Woeseiaceae bacterium]
MQAVAGKPQVVLLEEVRPRDPPRVNALAPRLEVIAGDERITRTVTVTCQQQPGFLEQLTNRGTERGNRTARATPRRAALAGRIVQPVAASPAAASPASSTPPGKA